MLKVEKLTKKYSNNRGIENINFSIKPGEIMGIIGENGSGKTTIFKCLLKLIKFNSGKISYKKIDIKEIDNSLFGYLPEVRSLYTDITVYDQIYFYGRLKNIDKKVLEERIEYWLEKTEFLSYEKELIGNLSKGNQQKVQLICCLIHNPDILILDEPITGLDVNNAEMFKNIIYELAKMKKTIIISSHQFDYIENFFDKVLVLKEGKQKLFGDVDKIKQKYQKRYIEIISKNPKEYYLLEGVNNQFINHNHVRLEIEDEEKAKRIMRKLLDEEEIISTKIELPTLRDIILEEI